MYCSGRRCYVRSYGGSEMSVKNINNGKNVLDSLIEVYGLNKVLSVFACSAGAALIGFVLSANLIPNDPTTIIEKENER